MKRKLLCTALCLALLTALLGTDAAASAPILRFAAMSDIHLDDALVYSPHSNESQFRTALSDAYDKGYSDLFICGGDMSSYGNTEIWTDIDTMVRAAGYSDILWTLGNHEYGTVIENTDGDQDFLNFTGLDRIYYHTRVNGIHFIFLACEGAEVSGKTIGSTQAKWFVSELAAAVEDAAGGPVFVVSHYPLSESGVDGRIASALEQYENVFFLWGHEHGEAYETYPITRYMALHKGYVDTRMGSVQYGTANVADELLVDVYEDRVVLTIERSDGPVIADKSTTVYTRAASDWPLGQLMVYGGRLWMRNTPLDVPNAAYVCMAGSTQTGKGSAGRLAPVTESVMDLGACRTDGGAACAEAILLDENFCPIAPKQSTQLPLVFGRLAG